MRSLDFLDIPAEASLNSLVDWVNRWWTTWTWWLLSSESPLAWVWEWASDQARWSRASSIHAEVGRFNHYILCPWDLPQDWPRPRNGLAPSHRPDWKAGQETHYANCSEGRWAFIQTSYLYPIGLRGLPAEELACMLKAKVVHQIAVGHSESTFRFGIYIIFRWTSHFGENVYWSVKILFSQKGIHHHPLIEGSTTP